MRSDLVIALALLVALLVIRAINRRTVAGRMQALMTDRTDPVAARQQLNQLMAEEGAKEAARRARLWEEAPASLQSARQLQKALQEDLEGNEEVRRYLREKKPGDQAAMQDLDKDRRETQEQLDRVEALIRQLRA